MKKNSGLYDLMMEYYTKQDIMALARRKHVSVKTNMRKGDIARLVADEMLRPEVMTEYIQWLDSDEREFLLSMVGLGEPDEGDGIEDDLMLPMSIWETGYMFFSEIGEDPFLPEDVKNLIRKMWTPELKESCRQYEWIVRCLELATQIYGIVPYTVLARLIRQKVQYGVAVSALPRILETMPIEINHYSIGDDSVHDIALEPFLMKLEFPEVGEDYYIPSVFEIENGLFYTEELERLMKLRIEDLRQKYHHELWCVEETAWRICTLKTLECSTCSMKDLFAVDGDPELYDDEMDVLTELGEKVCDSFKKLDRYFRRVQYHGFNKQEWDARHNNQPVQLPLDRHPQTIGPKPTQSAKVISLDERRRQKNKKP